MKPLYFAQLLFLLAFSPLLLGQSLHVVTDLDVPQVDLVVSELESVLHEEIARSGIENLYQATMPVTLVILFEEDLKSSALMHDAGTNKPDDINAEGFSIRRTDNDGKQVIWLVAADRAGLLYGGYEVAEQIACYGLNGIRETDQSPYMAMRGTKFNIPLDARSPSYTDASDAAQQNIGEMWNFDFWKNYIQSLSRNRYNYISCWSLHPFPSLVKVPGYEDIALEDVQRSTVHWEEHYPLEGLGLDTPEILENVEILKKMTMQQKISFWRKVMAYGKLHNIDFYFVTWNIFTNGIDGKYGITDDVDNPVTRDYFRKSVKQMFLTYPDLKGIGLTTGENMHDSTFEEKEDWAFDTYAMGVLDAVREQPGRKITFIHRQHMAGALQIADKFKPVIDHPDVDFIYSFKYAKAHVYSSTTQIYHDKFVEEIQDKGELKTIWTLRNDDVYYFRWGAPDFVREFIQNIPYDVSRGYYYGSDQYIWGREFLSRDPESPRQIEIDKHWYQWMLWGRLGYDPLLGNDRIISVLRSRYKGINAEKLFVAWQEASMIYPKTTGFHWGPLDFQWYIEACLGRPLFSHTPNGFHDVNRFITLNPHGGTDFVSIPNYVRALNKGSRLEGTDPFEVARQIHEHADTALGLLQEINYTGDKELRQTLDDIRTIAWLGKYYAHKIEAATHLALFRDTLDTGNRNSCIDNLNKAAVYWRSYAALALSNYENPLWTNRVGYVDWKEIFLNTLYDIRSVGGNLQLGNMEPSMGGSILEAESTSQGERETLTKIPGYTGKGYVNLSRDDSNPEITWIYEAKTAGRHALELRYLNHWDRRFDCAVFINGAKAGTLNLWEAGQDNNWVWDRMLVDLNKGTNRIRIKGGGRYFVDHLNVIPLLEK